MGENEKGIPMDYVTKEDLNAFSADIKEHISLIVKPIIDEQEEMKTVLSGPSRRNGLIGDSKTMKTELKIIYGLLMIVVGSLIKLAFFNSA